MSVQLRSCWVCASPAPQGCCSNPSLTTPSCSQHLCSEESSISPACFFFCLELAQNLPKNKLAPLPAVGASTAAWGRAWLRLTRFCGTFRSLWYQIYKFSLFQLLPQLLPLRASSLEAPRVFLVFLWNGAQTKLEKWPINPGGSSLCCFLWDDDAAGRTRLGSCSVCPPACGEFFFWWEKSFENFL